MRKSKPMTDVIEALVVAAKGERDFGVPGLKARFSYVGETEGIGSLTIKELVFISMDGGRIFVPMAELRQVAGDGVEYFWNLDSLEVKLCRIIGKYYIYESLEGVAARSHVALVTQ